MEKIKQELFLLPKLADELYLAVPDKVSRVEMVLLVLVAAMRAHLSDSIVLVRTGSHTTLPIILRSSIDTFADLKLVLKEPAHLERFLLQKNENRHAWLTVKLNSRKGVDGDIDDRRRAELVAEKASLENAIKSLKAKGINKLSVREKYKSAGLLEMYENAYGMLSADVHSDFDGASKRYLEFTNGAFRHVPDKATFIESDERRTIPLMCLNFAVAILDVSARLKVGSVEERANQVIVKITTALEDSDDAQ